MTIQQGYFTGKNFLNTIYALNIKANEHFANTFFDGDADRIVYASNSFALRKRSQGQEWSNAKLPFMNYRITEMENGVSRDWWNNQLNLFGTYFPQLSSKVRATPITVNYESSVWFHRENELQYAMAQALWDDSHETFLSPFVEVNGYDVKFVAILGYNLSFQPQYSESDWLERNQIRTIGLNFFFETFLLQTEDNIYIPEEVIFNFAHSKGLEPTTYDETYQWAIEEVS